jgi:hypothetical protein
MKKILISIVSLVFVAGLVPARAGQVSFGGTVSNGKLKSFYLSISDYYRVPEPELLSLRERYRLREEELPVVFFLAARARVEPSVIMGLRLRGRSWLDISFHFGLNPDVFYVPVTTARIGPPYGNAYGYFKKYRPNREWRKIVLTDREVIDLVNLRFMCEYHRMAPEAVMARRARGEVFLSINDEMGKANGRDKRRGNKGAQAVEDSGKGKRK